MNFFALGCLFIEPVWPMRQTVTQNPSEIRGSEQFANQNNELKRIFHQTWTVGYFIR